MASIRPYRRKSGEFTYNVLFRHRGHQTSETFSTRRAAEQFAAMIDRLGPEGAIRVLDARDGRPGAAMPTVARQIRIHIESLSGITPGTRYDYERYADEIEATALGQLPIDAVTRADVAGWIRTQEGTGRSGKTIRNRHTLISAAFKRAVHDGMIATNPAQGARIADTSTDEMVFLTPQEFAVLFERVSDYYKPLVLFLYGSGARWGEATALQKKDFSLDSDPATVTISRAWKYDRSGSPTLGPPKTRRARRTIALPFQSADLIRPLIGPILPDDLVFTTSRGGPIPQKTFWGNWDRWRRDSRWNSKKQAWVPIEPALGKKPRVHDLRHSHASIMIASGMDLLTLQYRLGHESIKTTSDRYGHLMPEAQIQAARASSTALAAIGPM